MKLTDKEVILQKHEWAQMIVTKSGFSRHLNGFCSAPYCDKQSTVIYCATLEYELCDACHQIVSFEQRYMKEDRL